MCQKTRHPASAKTTIEASPPLLTPSQASTSALARPLLMPLASAMRSPSKELYDETDNDTNTRACVCVSRRDRYRRGNKSLFTDTGNSLGFLSTAGVARPGEAIHADAAR